MLSVCSRSFHFRYVLLATRRDKYAASRLAGCQPEEGRFEVEALLVIQQELCTDDCAPVTLGVDRLYKPSLLAGRWRPVFTRQRQRLANRRLVNDIDSN